jgi:uncharacterized surface protein with fasciclin (FAS1) repeats
MKQNNTKLLLLTLLCLSALLISSCKDQWKEHNALINAENDLTLLDKINQQPELSSFAALLVRTGYDKVLASSKTFTVWAPTNEALAKINKSVLGEDSLARQFVANHIVNQNYLASALKASGTAEQRIQTLNGKFLTFSGSNVEDSKLLKTDLVVRNGVLHEIDAVLQVRQNIWDYITGLSGVAQKQVNFLRSSNYSIEGTTKVYAANGTRNDYLERVAALNDESKEYTYILLTDEAYDQEYSKLSRFFTVTNLAARYDSTQVYRTALQVTKDFVADHVVLPANLGSTLLATTAVSIPIDKSAVVSTYRASNGMVYIMNRVDFDVFRDKIRPIILEGEDMNSFSRTDRGGNILTRIRLDEMGTQFTDRVISGTGYAQFWARGRINNLYAGKYQVYWRALNDQGWSTAVPPAPVNFRQKLGFSSEPGALLPYVDIIPYTTVAYNNPDDRTRVREQLKEVYLGDITVAAWGFNQLYVIGDNVTTVGLNTTSLDYVKLVPIN